MKHVRESLSQYYDYKFFKLFEEETTDLKSKESQGLAVIDKIISNFDDFKSAAGGEITKFKEFWEENKKNKEGFSDSGNVYKLHDSDYVVGVLELPVETLSDGSLDGGLGATDEPEEEIIEGPEIGAEEDVEEPQEDFFEERPTNEAEEEEKDLDLDLDAAPEEDSLDLDAAPEEDGLDLDIAPEEETPEEDLPTDDLATEEPIEDLPTEEPVMGGEQANLTSPQTYLVVYDMASGEREEILRCGSNNVVNAFNAFYNDTFKGSMKNAILQYKEQKEKEKIEAEKTEKEKAQKEKDSKVNKFLAK